MNAPAGFWRRYAAYSVDAAVLAMLALSLLLPGLRLAWDASAQLMATLQMRLWELLDQSLDLDIHADPLALAQSWASDPVLHAGILDLTALLLSVTAQVAGTLFALAAVWFISTEASGWQASPGKRLAGLRVTDMQGRRCGPGRIVLRFFAGVPSWLLLNLGHAMAGWNPGKRALHDFIAGTRVELAPGAEAAMPRWARAWLWAQGAAFFGVVSCVLASYASLLVEASAGGLG